MRPMRTVYIPAIERTVTLRQYLKAIKLARANPDAIFDSGLTCWWPCCGAEIMQQFRQGMHARISAGIPYSLRGT